MEAGKLRERMIERSIEAQRKECRREVGNYFVCMKRTGELRYNKK